MIQFQFKPYQRPFQHPLQTHHGVWTVREGVILRLTDASGQVGWGEIAPLEAFGSESLAQALAFCRSLSAEITVESIKHIPANLPACQFGFESAWEWMISSTPLNKLPYRHKSNRSPLPPLQKGGTSSEYQNSVSNRSPLPPLQKGGTDPEYQNSVLLPAGKSALETWQTAYAQGTRTFKWKIGVESVEEELQTFEALIDQLPPGVKLRLDANGGLSWQEACHWLENCDAFNASKLHGAAVEFLEQPLPPHQFDAMLHLSQQFQTPIALDESIATLTQIKSCYERGWRGIFVIKAAIVGSPRQLRQFCQQHPITIVWSSVFETAIARTFIQQFLLPSIDTPTRAIGFGVDHWFADSLFNQSDFEQLWQSL